MARRASQDFCPTTPIGVEILSESERFERLLGPVMAGSRARGVADAFELMEIAVVLIDGSGCVLHAGGRAERMLRPLVHVAEGHLFGVTPDINQILQHIVSRAIAERAHANGIDRVEIHGFDGVSGIAIRIVRFPQDGPGSVQLLRAILVIESTDA